MAEIVESLKLSFGPRRGVYAETRSQTDNFPLADDALEQFCDFDLIYRSLCGILYNFAPTSGHPGGSISSGRLVAGLLFHTMDYLLGEPECLSADMISYAAGHKAMGLYAMWALRNECARIARPALLPDEQHQLRLEDLLGFRKNPTQGTPLFTALRVKPLEGHPTPQTPFVKLATGASGVGVPASFGLAFGAMDVYGEQAPLVHVVEGEGGMTAGRVSEALATAATAQLWNVKLHVDWNQASIDSNRVCRDGDRPGDYVQWNPAELCYLHDWNVIYVEDGSDVRQVLAAQALAKRRVNDQPTAVVYRTVKGWQYGIEGRKSHGAGHEFCSDAYYAMLAPLEKRFGVSFPALGDTFGYLNRLTDGAFIGAAADLLDSTSISKLGQGFPPGFYNAVANPEARMIATGGICEDCMGAFMSGVAAYGAHIGVGSSYGAFIVALQHIAARLHGIGQQARQAALGEPHRTFVIVCAHAGLKTGEDGATHADPQALQLVQGNFPAGVLITLTPWDPQELWPMTTAALKKRPAVLVPFVTRPAETIVDRAKMKLPPATEAARGIYALRRADRNASPYHGTIVLQGSEVANTFVEEVLPRLDRENLNMNVYYVSSAELFSLLPASEQEDIFPPDRAAEAMGITGFTLPTMYLWVTSPEGRNRTLHAFSHGHYLGSGQAHKVMEEAGLDGEGQWSAVKDYARWMETRQ
ncbi:MAG: hypothetical protein HZB20_03945 [Chloroflexi bacterium]|nr:hypothetical protein [Chloroflexota bacterium]